MSEEQWTAVDTYLDETITGDDDALTAACADAEAASLPSIAVTPAQGKLLYLLARMCGARNILEIGTLAGYSTIWMARALPTDGRMITLEYEQKHADVAVKNIARAGLAARVDVRVGAALESLPAIAKENKSPFDFIFIDADKANYPAYFDWAVRLGRKGTVIIADNVVRNGALADADSTDTNVVAMREMIGKMAANTSIESTVMQTVGAKGYDGFALSIVGD